MADQATLNGNGRAAQSPSRAAAKNLADLAHDVFTLCELQTKLLAVDLKQMGRQAILPVAMIAAALIAALGCIFTLFIAFAYVLYELAGLSLAASFGLSALAGAVLTAILAVLGVLWLKGCLATIQRSKQELVANLQALKTMLKSRSSR